MSPKPASSIFTSEIENDYHLYLCSSATGRVQDLERALEQMELLGKVKMSIEYAEKGVVSFLNAMDECNKGLNAFPHNEAMKTYQRTLQYIIDSNLELTTAKFLILMVKGHLGGKPSELLDGMQEFRATSNGPLTCPICQSTHNRSFELINHAIQGGHFQHFLDVPKPYACSIRGCKKTFGYPNDLVMHVQNLREEETELHNAWCGG